jgi:hypothetical protein
MTSRAIEHAVLEVPDRPGADPSSHAMSSERTALLLAISFRVEPGAAAVGARPLTSLRTRSG